MVRGKEISKEVRAQMLVLRDQNYSYAAIADILKVSKSAVYKGVTRARELGTFKSRNRHGRPE